MIGVMHEMKKRVPMHHFLDVTVAGGPFGSKDVVRADDRTRVSGE